MSSIKLIEELDQATASELVDSSLLMTSVQNGGKYTSKKMTLRALANYVNGIDIYQAIYPVGSIYTTIDKTFDPNITFGGTWVVIGEGRCLFGLSKDSSDVGQEINSTLPKLDVTFSSSTANVSITQQMVNGAGTPTNNQNRPAIGAGGGAVQGSFTATGTVSISGGAISATTQRNGSSQSVICNNENNDVRPPSIGVIFWKRSA